MDRKEACHRLADINESIYEAENSLESIESRLRWDDESRREWYLEKREKVKEDLERYKQEREAFINEYRDIIYS